ncbi:MAG: hypothetical protein ACOX2O_00550 [Bdellovibrionota bacterium]|jgi:Na+-driven multidrug efflux pump
MRIFLYLALIISEEECVAVIAKNNIHNEGGFSDSGEVSEKNTNLKDVATISQKQLFWLWLPLVATWALIGLELPMAHIMLTRLPNVEENLAALGVAFSIFIIVESPIFSMMSAATVLVSDKKAYYKLRNFNFCLGATLSFFLTLLLIPSVFKFLTTTILALPEDILHNVWWALLLYVPCPFFVGYRRFYQGILVRSGMNSRVGIGTMARVFVSIGSMLLLATCGFPGAIVGVGGCVSGMLFEAGISRYMVRPALKKLLADPASENTLTYPYIAKFYVPLALASIMGTAITPVLVFFLARGSFPVESLAVYPVLSGIINFSASAIIGLHDLMLGTLGDKYENLLQLKIFTKRVAFTLIAILSILLFTPLKLLLFGVIYGLPENLIHFATDAAIFIVLFLITDVYAFYVRAVLIRARKTAIVTFSSVMFLLSVFVLMMLLIDHTSIYGATAAVIALVIGNCIGIMSFLPEYKTTLKNIQRLAP